MVEEGKKKGIFPPIASIEDVRDLARQGLYAGLALFALILLSSLILIFSDGEFLGTVLFETEEERLYSLIGVGIELLIIGVLTWRVSTGRGYVSAMLLVLLFAVEVVSRALAGLGGLIIIIFLYIARGLINGVRATLAYNRYSQEAEIEDVF